MTVKQASNVLRFFEFFSAQQGPATLTQLADALRIPISSTSNLVDTLRSDGYLFEVKRRGGYYPTRKMHDLNVAILSGNPLLSLIHEAILDLRDETGETVLLAARDGSDVVYLDVVESTQGIRYSADVGSRKPIYAISSGKAMLGSLGDIELKREIELLDYSGAASTSITDPKALFENIVAGRKRGWHLNATEFTPDVSGVGMTLDVAGQKFGLSVAGPNYRMAGKHEDLAASLRDAIANIAAQANGQEVRK